MATGRAKGGLWVQGRAAGVRAAGAIHQRICHLEHVHAHSREALPSDHELRAAVRAQHLGAGSAAAKETTEGPLQVLESAGRGTASQNVAGREGQVDVRGRGDRIGPLSADSVRMEPRENAAHVVDGQQLPGALGGVQEHHDFAEVPRVEHVMQERMGLEADVGQRGRVDGDPGAGAQVLQLGVGVGGRAAFLVNEQTDLGLEGQGPENDVVVGAMHTSICTSRGMPCVARDTRCITLGTLLCCLQAHNLPSPWPSTANVQGNDGTMGIT